MELGPREALVHTSPAWPAMPGVGGATPPYAGISRRLLSCVVRLRTHPGLRKMRLPLSSIALPSLGSDTPSASRRQTIGAMAQSARLLSGLRKNLRALNRDRKRDG